MQRHARRKKCNNTLKKLQYFLLSKTKFDVSIRSLKYLPKQAYSLKDHTTSRET